MKTLLIRKTYWAAGLVIFFLVIFAGYSGAVDANMTNEQCLGCHKNFSAKQFVNQTEFHQSVHGAVSCSACHVALDSFTHAGKAVEAYQRCIACHSDISKKYNTSVHGREELGCSACHGKIHAIVPSSDIDSPVTHLNVVETCSTCHDGKVVESYLHSFHGIANKSGSKTTAQCVSCHGSHNILGPDDPASLASKENIPARCAECHGGEAWANFAEGPEHFSKEPGGPGAPMYWTLKFFTWLTIITISLLIIHIELELFRKLKETKS